MSEAEENRKVMNVDEAEYVKDDVGGRDEPEVAGYDEDYPVNNNWLVPNRQVDESKLRKNFDPDTVTSLLRYL